MRIGLSVLTATGLCLPLHGSGAVASSASTNAPTGLRILARAEWGANPPVTEMKRHTPTRITIHHTATLQKPERALKDKMQALQRFSQSAGTLGNGKPKLAWPDVPYHYYIAANGEVAEGRIGLFAHDIDIDCHLRGLNFFQHNKYLLRRKGDNTNTIRDISDWSETMLAGT
jgi:hypothetical protein